MRSKFTDANGREVLIDMVALGGAINSDGLAAGLVKAELDGKSGTVQSIWLTCNSTDDVATDPSAPVAAELFTITGMDSGKTNVSMTFLTEDGAVPYSAGAIGTVNQADDAAAIDALTVADNGVGDYSSFKGALLSVNQSLAYDFIGVESDTEINRFDVVFLPVDGTGAGTVRVRVDFW